MSIENTTPEQIITTLDSDKDKEISVEELKANLDKLDPNSLSALADFLKSKNSDIINAFTDATGKNTLKELAITEYSSLLEEFQSPTDPSEFQSSTRR